jgi:hypothetical protein
MKDQVILRYKKLEIMQQTHKMNRTKLDDHIDFN